MTEKPTYEKLEQRVKELEKESIEWNRKKESLLERKSWFITIVETIPDAIYLKDIEGRYLFVNKAFEKIVDKKRENTIGKSDGQLLPQDLVERAKSSDREILRGLKSVRVEQHQTEENGEKLFYDTIKFPLFNRQGNIKGLGGVSHDMTERKKAEEALWKSKQAEEELCEAHNELEHRVKERTKELGIKRKGLEELNTAMRVLLKKREADKAKIGKYVLANVKQLIEPYFEKIKKTKLNDQQGALLRIVESNLNEIISPFTQEVSLKHFNLTSTEIQIAKQIRYGDTTKKIAQFMNVSPRTVETHRKNIRRKIGLEGKKANLRTYLLSIN